MFMYLVCNIYMRCSGLIQRINYQGEEMQLAICNLKFNISLKSIIPVLTCKICLCICIYAEGRRSLLYCLQVGNHITQHFYVHNTKQFNR